MSLYIVDSALKQFSGHPYNQCKGLMSACDLFGLVPIVLSNKHSEGSIVNDFSALPCLTYAPYAPPVSSDPFEDFRIKSELIADELTDVLLDQLGAEDFVLVPVTRHYQLRAVALLASRLSVANRPKWMLYLCDDFKPHRRFKTSDILVCYRQAFGELMQYVHPSRLLLSADSQVLADRLTELLQYRVQQSPMPLYYPSSLTVSPSSPSLKIGVFGQMNVYKGTHLLYDLIQRFQSVHWVIQASDDRNLGYDYTWFTKQVNVEMLAEGLDPVAYYRHFSAVDIILAPYEKSRVGFSSSGILSEAAAAGKVIVATATPWVIEHLAADRLSACIFAEQDTELICEALQTVLNSFQDYQQLAISRASEWRNTQSSIAYVAQSLEYFKAQRVAY